MTQLDIPPTDILSSITNLETQFNLNPPYYAQEVLQSKTDLKRGERIDQNLVDYSYPIFFKNQKLRIQTPPIQLMFPISKYKNPGSNITKYSTHLSLRNEDIQTKQFIALLKFIDQWALEQIPLPPERYYSPIRYNHANPQLPPVLRLKIANVEDSLLLDIYKNHEEILEPSVSEATEIMKHRTTIIGIIELNPIWIAGQKFGVSYKLIQLQVLSSLQGPMFRS